MASAAVSDVFNCSVEEFYKIITNYEGYSQFLSEVKECHLLESQGNRKLVEFHISFIKNFKYSLWITEDPGKAISWTFAKGDIFKQLDGGWKLSDEAGRTRAAYNVEAKMGLLVPSPIAKGLIEVNLPNMMSSYHKRVKELYGR
jgi:coenzyme Q-binding protein COQ10